MGAVIHNEKCINGHTVICTSDPNYRPPAIRTVAGEQVVFVTGSVDDYWPENAVIKHIKGEWVAFRKDVIKNESRPERIDISVWEKCKAKIKAVLSKG